MATTVVQQRMGKPRPIYAKQEWKQTSLIKNRPRLLRNIEIY